MGSKSTSAEVAEQAKVWTPLLVLLGFSGNHSEKESRTEQFVPKES